MISTKFQYQTKKVLVLSLIINHAASAFNGPLLQGGGSTAFLKHVSPQEQTQLFSLASDSNEINPSSEFGSPISEKNAELNRATVTFIKSAVFGNLFVGADRDYARFYALETIARMPYFSYLSVLHLYETLGWWRKAKYMKIHFAESWNEMHHLLIMESLGGNEKWGDRFVAQHIAFGYYWAAVFLYMFNPTMAYNLNEAVEEHAFLTYDGFLKENEEKLKKIPAPAVAKEYYRDGDLYMFDEFQTSTCEPRRPKCDTLYDTFINVRDDEAEHMKTMNHLQQNLNLVNTHYDSCALQDDS